MPQREVFNKLARGDDQVIDKQERVFFRDIYDHLVRLYDISESLRDLISGVLETYLSVINNRMNDVMKTLTIITTVFMPISFLTGFFGMNFFAADPPFLAWTSETVFIIVLCIFVILPTSMFFWMRSRKWM
jgi:magnesium transporter